MARTDARIRHLPPVPTAVFMALDAFILAAVGFLVAAVEDQLSPVILASEIPQRLFPVAGFRPAWMLAHVVLLPFGFLSLGQYRMLQPGTKGWSFTRILLCFAGLGLVLLAFLRLIGYPPDYVFIVASGLAGLAGVTLLRGAVNARLRRQVAAGQRVRNVLVVGTSSQAQQVARQAIARPLLGRRIVGFVRPPADEALGEAPSGPSKPWTPTEPEVLRQAIVENSLHQPRHLWAAYEAATDEQISAVLDGLGVEEAFLAPELDTQAVGTWLRLCQARGVDVHLMPRHHFGLGIRPAAWQFGRFVLLDIHRRPLSPLGWWTKRAMDAAVSFVALLIASPIILACAIAIKLEQPKSPVFYGGRRVGLKGRHFRQWKFATMRPDADAFRAQLAAKNARQGPWFQLDEADDPRITKVGRFLRKYSLNDIPQLWNVFLGEMSMVGPRPLAADEVSRFIQYDIRYYRCLDVKPGITGLWQISDRMNPSFDYRIAKDLEYIETWSAWKDLTIMAKTPFAMLKGGR